jgi:glutamate-1-semialdehyde 2,1-aminomutase
LNKDIISKRYFDVTGSEPSKPYGCSAESCRMDRIMCGRGARIRDASEKEYLDFCLGSGALVLGHADDDFLDNVRRADSACISEAKEGLEAQYAKMIREAFPSMECSLFMDSENAALVRAVEMARLLTGRNVVIKIVAGCSRSRTEGENTLVMPFNDLESLTGSCALREAAALILEPVPCFPGPVVPNAGYLHDLREIADANDIMLVFNEINTGFRLAMGGAQEYYRVIPDITVLGKIAGGGYPIGVLGAPADLMRSKDLKVNELGPALTSTFPLMAGMETMERLRLQGHDRLNEMGERMGRGLEAVLNEFHVRYKASAVGSMFQVFLDLDDSLATRAGSGKRPDLYPRVWERLLENGVLFSPWQRGTNFISTAHTDTDIDDTVNAILISLGEIAL